MLASEEEIIDVASPVAANRLPHGSRRFVLGGEPTDNFPAAHVPQFVARRAQALAHFAACVLDWRAAVAFGKR